VAFSSLVGRVPSPNLGIQRALGVLAVITQCGIAMTGSIVRVTESGLGCPTWPECSAGSLVPIADPINGQLHQWIEFSNRLLGIAVGVVAALVFLAAVFSKPARRRYILLALTMPLGIVLQAVIGGITVLMKLDWWTVSLHFLPTPLLVWLAVVLLRSITEGDKTPQPLLPKPLRALLVAMSFVLGGLLVVGTLVTAAGPHAGDIHTPRLDLPVSSLAQLHADFLFVFVGMLAAFGFAVRITGGTRAIWQRYWLLVVTVVAQAVLGMVQYFLGVPDVLVALHVLGSTLVVAAIASLWCATRTRGPLPARVTPAPTPEPATAQ
jgi:heme a synthase